MKRLMVVAAGTLALMAGAAHAGEGGCSYGKHLASQKAKSPVVASVEEAQQNKLEAIEQQASVEALIKKPVALN